MENFVAPSARVPRKGHRRSASATAPIPQSLGLELQLRYDAQARAAEIVDQWIAKHAAATQCQSGTTDTAADAPAPSGEVGDDLPAATQSPAALQPSDTVEPTMVELPVTSDGEEMDETTTRKRGRDSEDEEELPKQSRGPGAHSDSKRKPLTPPSTPAATEPVPAAATSTEGRADTTAAAEKTSPFAAPGKPATTTPGVAASQKTADSHQPEPRRKAPPQTAADFLKRNQRPATNVATKKQLKKTAKGKQSQLAGAPQARSSSSQGAPAATPATPPQQAGPRQRTPEASTNLAGASEPAGSTPEVPDDFRLVMSRAARRRNKATVALPADPAVAGTVLFRRCSLPCRCSLPAYRTRSTGFVYGVDGSHSDA
ncbi:proteoglycan 4-like [Dermacentor silvarum]|uniref:proteoglycan 4-like n=1 Tax=Dermacentor silvarum TaxID=543639 RepID=UPI00189AB5C1|nr:proteoglycan 4-like [Dermacentor silvarum]